MHTRLDVPDRLACVALALSLCGCGAPPRPVDTPAGVVAWDLTADLARAELRLDGRPFVDLRRPGAARYRAELHADAGEGRVDVRLPVERGGAAVLRGRVVAPGAERVHVSLDGRHVGSPLAERAFAIDVGHLDAGEHRLAVRRGRSEPGPLRLSWVLAAEALDDASWNLPPAPTRVGARRQRLRLHPRWSHGVVAELPPGARLTATVDAPPPARLRVDVSDDRTRYTVARVEGGSLDLDLSPFGGRPVRLDLTAERGPVTVDRPRVTVPATRRGHGGRPNVLVVLVDTLRADRIGAVGGAPHVATPAVSRLAASGVVFTHAHGAANWTKPSVATLLTGLHPWEHGVTTHAAVLPSRHRTMAELMREGGYATAGFIANGYIGPGFGFGRGWDELRTAAQGPASVRALGADLLSWLDRRPTDRPFFAYVHTVEPHSPYTPSERALRRLDPEPYRGPIDFTREPRVLHRIREGELTPDARDRARLVALYEAEVADHDVGLAWILDGLEARGLLDETLVVVTADHGEELFDHGSVHHGPTLYQELLHVPLVMSGPGMAARGRRVTAPVGLVDVLPTVLEAAELAAPPELSGRSLWPVATGGADAPWPRLAMAALRDQTHAVVTERFKLVEARSGHVLYDLREDPDETRDVAAAHPRVVSWLRGAARSAVRVAPLPERSDAEVDAETAAQLEALGYTGVLRPR